MSNTRKIAKSVSSVSDFKKPVAPIELPSGAVMRLKNPGLMSMANKGLIPNGLMATIQAGLSSGKEPTPEEIMGSNVDISEMLEMVDTIVISCAVEPRVYRVPVWDVNDVEVSNCTADEVGTPCEQKKSEEKLYVDELDDEDKMFIFQWTTGGTTDVEQFRAESANSLASVAGLKAVGGTAKRAAPRRK